MAEENFLRTYTMKCGPAGSKGFEIGNLGSPKGTALHISFSIEKSDAESANTAKIQVWNLSDQNLNILDSRDCVVELKAGYGGNNALLLVGNITSAVTVMDCADRMTELEAADGRAELRDTNITVSYNGPTDCKEIYQYTAGQMGLAIKFAEALTFKTLPNGYSFVGKGRTVLQRLADCCGHAWSVQNGIIQVTYPGKPVSEKGYLLSSDTGLIGKPKRITIGSNAGNRDSQTGWEVEYLLNGAIGVNDVVRLESRAASGYFRVCKITMDGDNMEGDWMCTAQLLEIK